MTFLQNLAALGIEGSRHRMLGSRISWVWKPHWLEIRIWAFISPGFEIKRQRARLQRAKVADPLSQDLLYKTMPPGY